MTKKRIPKKAPNKTAAEEVAAPEIVEAVKENKPAKKVKKLYWQTRVHITAFGIVQGEVVPEHLAAFKEKAPEDINMAKWVGDSDPIEAQKKERAAIAKARREGRIKE